MSIDHQMSDEKLALLLQKGSHDAFNELMSRYKGRLYSFICRYIMDREEAYDILQETFINIYRKIHLYDANKRFSTWAFQIALNKCRDWGRKNTLKRIINFSSFNKIEDHKNFIENLTDQKADPEHIISDKQDLEIISKAIFKLPEKLKAPLIMCVLEEMSQEECARILGVSQKTVETRIYRARKKLSNI